MKKTLLAFAAVSACGVASAQSSITLFGTVDTVVQHATNSSGPHVTRIHNSGYLPSALGFRGTEDLGGGLLASFWFEAAVNSDDGSGVSTNINNQTNGGAATGLSGAQGLTFSRRSTVSLAGPWGEIRLGRDYVPQFWNLSVFTSNGTLGVGNTLMFSNIVTGPTSARASNSIGYFLPPNLGGIYGQVQHYRGENLSTVTTADDGTGFGMRIGYLTPTLNVAFSTGRTGRAGPLGDIRQSNIGGHWDFRVAKLLAAIGRDRGNVGAVAARGESWAIGAHVPLGNGRLRLGYSQYKTELATGTDPTSSKASVGYVYDLSKRTSIYTTYAKVRNRNGARTSIIAGVGSPAPNGSASGFDLGLRHSF